jgi:hypothetical protein
MSLQKSFADARRATQAPPGPEPITPSDSALVKSWNAEAGGTALAAITVQAGSVMMAQSTREYSEMRQACGSLASAVQSAQAAPAIPDSAMEAKYTAALTAFKAGAAECSAAIAQSLEGVEDTVTTVNHAELNQSVTELETGLTDLYVATETLRKH